MKTYGVNWFLVWFGLLVLLCPVYLWAEAVLLLSWRHAAHLQPPILAQALGQSLCWTFLYYFLYGKILTDPKAVERVRQSLQRSEAARRRHYRWPLTWAVVFALVGIISAISRLIFSSPSWLYVVGYSLLLPCSCLVCLWLIDKATRKGHLERLLRASEEVAP